MNPRNLLLPDCVATSAPPPSRTHRMQTQDITPSGALVFYSEFDDFNVWKQALQSQLPQLKVLHSSEMHDPAEVHYALVWKAPAGFFSQMPNLRLIINLGAGVDALVARDDLPEHVSITRLEDPNMARMMASYVLFAVLRHAREIPFFEQAQHQSQWSYRHPQRPEETTVAVLGLGQLGKTAAFELQRQGFKVLGWSRTRAHLDNVTCYAGMDELNSVLVQANIVVVMLPHTPQTKGLLSRERLQLLPHSAAIVNVARGTIIDQTAMTELLQTGHISSAVLDVFEKEPLPTTDPLWKMPNVLITPHLASVAIPASSATQIVENIIRISSDLPPLKAIDPTRGY